MSKFEPRAAEQKCGNCKWWEDTDLTLVTYPMQGRCRKFEVPVSGDHPTCLEDEKGWKAEDVAEKVKEFAEKPETQSLVINPEDVAKIEERLTEIEGVLSSIGSPDYDLRKKVEGLEKGLAQLTDTFYICANNETHNYEDLRKRLEALEKVGVPKTETTIKKKNKGDKMNKVSVTFEKTDGKWALSILEDRKVILTACDIDRLYQVEQLVENFLDAMRCREDKEREEKKRREEELKREHDRISTYPHFERWYTAPPTPQPCIIQNETIKPTPRGYEFTCEGRNETKQA